MRNGKAVINLWGRELFMCWRKKACGGGEENKNKSKNKNKSGDEYVLIIANINSNERYIWWKYGHSKQMVENYHSGMKNNCGMRKPRGGSTLFWYTLPFS